MKVLFDTNIIIDIWQCNPEYVLDSFAAYDVCVLRGWKPYIAVTAVPDIEYLFIARDIVSKAEANKAMEALFEMFDIIDAQQCDCVLAREDVVRGVMPDLEDGIIAHSAKRTKMDVIVTRNIKHFHKSPVPAISPHDFVSLYKPADVDYSLESLLG